MSGRKSREITVRGFVPDGNGGYRPYEELSAEEKKAFGEKLVQRMGDAINQYASVHPEAIPRIIAAGCGKRITEAAPSA